MHQGVFVKQNEQKWKLYEEEIARLSSLSADQVGAMYVHLTEDLAFCQAKYPDTKLHQYLTDLTMKVHHHIYQNRPEEKSRLVTFWTEELPAVLRESRSNIIFSFLIMLVGVGVGLLSSMGDDGFIRLILGNEYVDLTLQNIESGDPMAVYKGHSESEMFFMITINNIRVSFLAFAFGLMVSVGTGYILFTNGVMIGVFHYLFFKHGLFDETILTIWIHGTLEISAIVIAGAAGLTMGNAILFPKNYPRIYSFGRGARKGLKIVLSLLPFFITAGFLESVITRNTHWPLWAKLIVISVSLAIVLFYLFVLPNLGNRGKDNH